MACHSGYHDVDSVCGEDHQERTDQTARGQETAEEPWFWRITPS